MYSGHNGGTTGSSGGNPIKKSRRTNAIEIIDPKTGKSIELFENDGPKGGEASNREAPEESVSDFKILIKSNGLKSKIISNHYS